MQKVHIETYGCQMNVGDTQIVLSILREAGYEHTGDVAQADIILINTCSVREGAEQRVWGRLGEMRRHKRRGALVGVIGCMAERLRNELVEKGGADIVAGPDSYRDLPRLIAQAGGVSTELSQEETYADIAPVRTDDDGVSAFIAIMRGCNNFCSYCVVPFTRGRERSRDPQTILSEARDLFEKGYREVTLLGQNVNSYSWGDPAPERSSHSMLAGAIPTNSAVRPTQMAFHRQIDSHETGTEKGLSHNLAAQSADMGNPVHERSSLSMATDAEKVLTPNLAARAGQVAFYPRIDFPETNAGNGLPSNSAARPTQMAFNRQIDTTETGTEKGLSPDLAAPPTDMGDRNRANTRGFSPDSAARLDPVVIQTQIDFPDLLKMVAGVSPLLRVRFATSHPKDLSDKLIDTMAATPNICPSIHLPAQSGSSRMLALMNRKYTREWYLERLAAIRRAIPDCSVTTDLIAGFCSETDDDHRQTLSLMHEAGYDFAYMFKYSVRPGTVAARTMADDVPEDVKSARLTEIIALQNGLSHESNRRDVGKRFEVLVEGRSKRRADQLTGRTPQNKTVVFDGTASRGDYVTVEITGCTQATLIGKMVE